MLDIVVTLLTSENVSAWLKLKQLVNMSSVACNAGVVHTSGLELASVASPLLNSVHP